MYFRRHTVESCRTMASKLERISRNQPWPNCRHCPRIRQEGQKWKGRAHLEHLASSAAFEGGAFRIGNRNITDSKRRFEVSDFLKQVEEEWSGICTLLCPVRTCQKAGCIRGRVWTRWWTERTLNPPEIEPQLSASTGHWNALLSKL